MGSAAPPHPHPGRDLRVATRQLETWFGERIGVQPPAIDLDPQQLLQPDVAEAHLRPEMIEQGELTGLGGSLERHGLQAERVSEPIRETPVQPPAAVEQPDPQGALPRLQHELPRPRVEPGVPGADQ